MMQSFLPSLVQNVNNHLQQKNDQTFSNLASLLQSFELGKEHGEDLIFFVYKFNSFKDKLFIYYFLVFILIPKLFVVYKR